uniref:Uncharacterized protein n=1 Tax=Aegilops tauschii subsp. strangulata TaxID=200361 RepID=A0A453IT81_AEGTS
GAQLHGRRGHQRGGGPAVHPGDRGRHLALHAGRQRLRPDPPVATRRPRRRRPRRRPRGLHRRLLAPALAPPRLHGPHAPPRRRARLPRRLRLRRHHRHLRPPRAHVADEPGRWDEIKTCLAATAPVCSELNQTYAAPQDFFAAWLSPMQSGCCKPPTRCGYTFVSATNWISPIDGAADPDCAAWSNDQDRLCYSCDSCKAGLLQNLRREWRRADVVLAVTVVALLAVYAMGCYAFRTARTDELFRRYRQGYT